MLGFALIVCLILVLLGVLPHYNYSSGWGYGPSGLLGFCVVIVIVIMLFGWL